MIKETDRAIERGWDAAHTKWRQMALEILCQTCLTTQTFTVNDFRDKIKKSGIHTHDNRAMGGLMVTGKKYGWLETTGRSIPSVVGHKVPIQIWQSKIYLEQSKRELLESAPTLF